MSIDPLTMYYTREIIYISYDFVTDNIYRITASKRWYTIVVADAFNYCSNAFIFTYVNELKCI